MTAKSAALLRQAEAGDSDTDAQDLLVDIDSLFDDIARDPAAWGFESLSPCLPDGGAPDCTALGSADRRVVWNADGTPNGALALRVTFVVATALALVSTVVLRKGATHDSPW